MANNEREWGRVGGIKFCYCYWVLTKVKGNTPHKDLPKFVKKGRCLKEKK
jgi:hypothetical protein